jgi:hypothetical protein
MGSTDYQLNNYDYEVYDNIQNAMTNEVGTDLVDALQQIQQQDGGDFSAGLVAEAFIKVINADSISSIYQQLLGNSMGSTMYAQFVQKCSDYCVKNNIMTAAQAASASQNQIVNTTLQNFIADLAETNYISESPGASVGDVLTQLSKQLGFPPSDQDLENAYDSSSNQGTFQGWYYSMGLCDSQIASETNPLATAEKMTYTDGYVDAAKLQNQTGQDLVAQGFGLNMQHWMAQYLPYGAGELGDIIHDQCCERGLGSVIGDNYWNALEAAANKAGFNGGTSNSMLPYSDVGNYIYSLLGVDPNNMPSSASAPQFYYQDLARKASDALSQALPDLYPPSTDWLKSQLSLYYPAQQASSVLQTVQTYYDNIFDGNQDQGGLVLPTPPPVTDLGGGMFRYDGQVMSFEQMMFNAYMNSIGSIYQSEETQYETAQSQVNQMSDYNQALNILNTAEAKAQDASYDSKDHVMDPNTYVKGNFSAQDMTTLMTFNQKYGSQVSGISDFASGGPTSFGDLQSDINNVKDGLTTLNSNNELTMNNVNSIAQQLQSAVQMLSTMLSKMAQEQEKVVGDI